MKNSLQEFSQSFARKQELQLTQNNTQPAPPHTNIINPGQVYMLFTVFMVTVFIKVVFNLLAAFS